MTKLETDLGLLPERYTGRPKSAVVDENVEKIERSLKQSKDRRSKKTKKKTFKFGEQLSGKVEGTPPFIKYLLCS